MKILGVLNDPLGEVERRTLLEAVAGHEVRWLMFPRARGEWGALEGRLGLRAGARLDAGGLMRRALPLARERFVDFCAEWPRRPLRDGKGFAERFVKDGLSLWWLCELSQKNAEARPTFTQLCQLEALRLALAERRYDRVALAVRDRDMAEVFSQLCGRAGVPVVRVGRRHGRWAESILVLLLKRVKDFIADLLCAFLAARLPDPSTAQAPVSARRIAFHTWYPTQWVPWHGELRDRYYVHLPDVLASEAGWEPLYACTVQADTLRGLARNWAAAARWVRGADRGRFIFLQRFASPWEVCRAYWSLRDVVRYLYLEWFDRSFRATFDCGGVNLFPLARYDLRVSFLRQMPQSLLLARRIRRFVTRTRPLWLVTTLETYCSGRAIIWGVRSSGTGTRVLGYQHSPVNENQLFYRYRPEELRAVSSPHDGAALSMPLPDLFLLQGMDAKRMLETSGVEPERLALCGSPRFDDLPSYRERRRTERPAIREGLGLPAGRRVVLVVGVSWPERTLQLLRLCAEATDGRQDCLLLFKPHPLYRPPARGLRAALGRRAQPDWWRESAENLNLLQAAADVMVTAHSTSDVEALVIGCPVIRVVLTPVESSPSGEVPGAGREVETATELAEALQAVFRGEGPSVDWARLEEGVFYKLDGRATQRIREVFEQEETVEPPVCLSSAL